MTPDQRQQLYAEVDAAEAALLRLQISLHAAGALPTVQATAADFKARSDKLQQLIDEGHAILAESRRLRSQL